MRLVLGSEADAFFAAMEQPPVRGLRLKPEKMPNSPLGAAIRRRESAVPIMRWPSPRRRFADFFLKNRRLQVI
jgi:hypothetical protein